MTTIYLKTNLASRPSDPAAFAAIIATAEQNAALDINDFCTAYGLKPAFNPDPDNIGKLLLAGVDFQQTNSGTLAARADFTNDPPAQISFAEVLPDLGHGVFDRGQNINVLVTPYVDGADQLLVAQLNAWFGFAQPGGWPVCPSLATWTEPTHVDYPNRGGVTRKMTPRGTILIETPIMGPLRA